GQASFHAGIEWYEFRKTGSDPWALRQQGTVGSASEHHWLGSIRLNGDQTIGLGFSVSGENTFPSIRYCGQSKTAYAAGNSIMDYPEDTILIGRFSQENSNRWGYEAALAVDASNDRDFWFTSEYIDSVNNLATRIALLKFGKFPLVKTLAPTQVTPSSATLNGKINPNTLTTTWRFEWGTSIPYSDSSVKINAGAGNTFIPVSYDLNGLSLGVTYHYRLVGENAEGRMEGNDMTVTPGAAVVTTRAVSWVEVPQAFTGGDVSLDGGSPVIQRGVCWGTAVNPTISGKRTYDGVGTGSFFSILDSLQRNNAYHVRAYAVNSYGTWYGQDRAFSTTCNTFTPPFSESFPTPFLPDCWSVVDHKGNSQVWNVGKVTLGDPLPALDGDYAYVDSESYGSSGVQNTDLVSPMIDCSSFINISLSFKHFLNSDQNSWGELDYSINGGLSWNVLQMFYATSATNPETFNVNVPDASGKPQVMFRWNYHGAFSKYWAVDNILVSGNPANMLSITPHLQKVSAAPASTTIFTIQCGSTWTASCDQPWVQVTPSGSGSGVISASYEVNQYYQSRTADITVNVPGRPSATVYIEQSRSTVGIEEIRDDRIVIYPNPSNGHITLVPSDPAVIELEVNIWDTRGSNILDRSLKGSNEYSLDLGPVPDGIYFIRVSAGTWTVTKKLAVSR
ncbi:MAG: T9SS type A sorting domain-containing protein, partial [Bacteroidota bacterium]